MTPEELVLDLPGLRVTALAWGPADGQPVLAFHGWLDNAASFSKLAPLLPGRRVVALDLPGHGCSDWRPAGVHYHFVDWVVDVAAAADALGWDRFEVIGHSMGAGVACLLAGTLPERVTRLVMLEGMGPLSCVPEDAPGRLARSITSRTRREGKQPREHADLDAMVQRLLKGAETHHTEETARLLVERGTRATESGGVTWSADPRLRGLSPLRISEEHVHAFLAGIACPTLIVRARAGLPFEPSWATERMRKLHDGRWVEVEGGHHVHLVDAPAVAAAVVPFLQGHTSKSTQPTTQPTQAKALPAALRERAMGLRLAAFDVDGVLTDGGLSYDTDDRETKRFSVKDGLGLKLLTNAGIEVALISARKSLAVERRAKELGLTHVLLGIGDKVAALTALLEELKLEPEQVSFMGDDFVDLAVLKRVGLPAAPADARPEVRAVARFVTRAAGGHGAVREFAETVIKLQGRWDAVLAAFDR
ncbi:alpha/beta fold hydrolase [Planctomycetota bacterium]|nr:alpha/beta fold hydrolase [Planctomycetota bacterium]